MPGFFSLEAAKEGLAVRPTIEGCIQEGRAQHEAECSATGLGHIPYEADTLWHKVDHLLYLPILGLTRPRDLYYYQGQGMQVLYGFTYKYLTLEHFLGQLRRLQVGNCLADRLAYLYAQAWYPGQTPLYLYGDWHVKPHWSKQDSHSGHVTMWGRLMPGTKQLLLSGPDGYLLGGWNYPIDTHFSQLLGQMEVKLSQKLARPILCTIVDSEGNGQRIAQQYAAHDGHYISILPRHQNHCLAAFTRLDHWQPVVDDDGHEAVWAEWADVNKAARDPRRFVLMRPVDRQEPTRIYAGLIPETLPAALVPWLHRRRWANNELRIRELIAGANLNANYGYTYTETPQRSRQREWQTAQAKVEVTQRQLDRRQEAIGNLRQQVATLQQHIAQSQDEQTQTIVQLRQEHRQRQRRGQPLTRSAQHLNRQRQQQQEETARFQKRQGRLLRQLQQHQTSRGQLQRELAARETARDAIDTVTLCRERELEKDQLMLDFQVLLANLHDWARTHYFAPQWQRLTLEKATQLIYRKSGQVAWHEDRIEVLLDPYRYQEHQRAMEHTCQRFNQANLRWRDGRRLIILVRQPP